MANEEQLALIKQGQLEWNRWRLSHPDVAIDLTGVDLRKGNLVGRDLQGVDLRGTNLSGALLWYADLQGAELSKVHMEEAELHRTNLTQATLTGAHLTGSHLTETNLQNTNMQKVNLQKTILHYANLTSADLTGADLRGAAFSQVTLTGMTVANALLWLTRWNDVDFRGVIGLPAVRHLGPSTIGCDTLIASHGQIPDEFLRGCGVSDDFITFAHTLAQTPRYDSVILSYDPEDAALGTRLYDDLQISHVRCWAYPLNMKLGERADGIYLNPKDVMRIRQKLVVLISQSGIQSEWLPNEMKVALRQEEQDQRILVVPITLDTSLFHEEEEWARRLRERHSILDFTGWENPSVYAAMFEQLLNILRHPPAAE